MSGVSDTSENIADDLDDISDEGNPVDDKIRQISTQDPIAEGMERLITDALQEGLPAHLEPELRRIIFSHRPIWEDDLKEPALVHPMIIRLKPGAIPVRCVARRYTPLQSDWMRQYVKSLLDQGLINKNSDSKWASPAIVVKKPHGDGYRLCVDLRAVNAMTESSAWPMPMLEVALGKIQGSQCFATLDMQQGYWQFPLDEAAQEICSFMTDEGVYSPTRISQGTKNGVNYFQSGMTGVMSASPDPLDDVSIVWIDDIIEFDGTPEGLLNSLDKTFDKFITKNIRCSLTKCKLFAKKVKWVGKIISGDGIAPDPEKTKALQDMARPETAADLMQFVCAMNWLRSSLVDYVRTMSPLSNLLEQALASTPKRTKRDAKKIKLTQGLWTEEHDVAFTRCKQMLADACTLAFPDPTKELCLFTDASEHSWSGVLTQIPTDDIGKKLEDQRHEPLYFLGGQFKASSKNWAIIEKEAFAIVESCTRLDYLLQRENGFRIFADHKNLVYLFDPLYRPTAAKKFTEEKLQRWALRLNAFPFTIEHVTGEDNVWADLLTRWGSAYSSRSRSAITNETPVSVDSVIPPKNWVRGVFLPKQLVHISPEKKLPLKPRRGAINASTLTLRVLDHFMRVILSGQTIKK